MNTAQDKLLYVGDNPFHNISHLCQERARDRVEDPSEPKYAAKLISLAVDNGANGFTFSVSENTLQILQELETIGLLDKLHLSPVVPYAFDYVRLAAQLGGIPQLTKKVAGDIIKSGNLRTMAYGFKGLVTNDLSSLLKAYLGYEVYRIKNSVKSDINLDSIWLHQLITDIALSINADWIFRDIIKYLISQHITPGFNTGNFNYLVNKCNEWNIDLSKVLIAAPFNKVGFQVTPSIEECEKTLSTLPKPNVIALSVLAAGYIKPEEAIRYIAALPNIRGVAIGISKDKHANIFSLSKQLLH
jgi:hypothetical protein